MVRKIFYQAVRFAQPMRLDSFVRLYVQKFMSSSEEISLNFWYLASVSVYASSFMTILILKILRYSLFGLEVDCSSSFRVMFMMRRYFTRQWALHNPWGRNVLFLSVCAKFVRSSEEIRSIFAASYLGWHRSKSRPVDVFSCACFSPLIQLYSPVVLSFWLSVVLVQGRNDVIVQLWCLLNIWALLISRFVVRLLASLANVYPRLLDFVGTLITFKLIGGVYVSPFILQDLINILNHVDINDKPWLRFLLLYIILIVFV